MPIDDNARYEKMSSRVALGTGPEYTAEGFPASENSWLFLLSAGPIGSRISSPDSSSWSLAPGDTCSVAFTVVCARWSPGAGGDSPAQRNNLYVNYDWAQKAYDGEDKNRNNVLDEGEDTNNNQIIEKQNIILHLKCSVSDIVKTDSFAYDPIINNIEGFNIDTKKEVDNFYNLALKLGAVDEGIPGPSSSI